jgi:hypothetical protein
MRSLLLRRLLFPALLLGGNSGIRNALTIDSGPGTGLLVIMPVAVEKLFRRFRPENSTR